LISYHAILAVAMLNGDDGLAKTMLDKSVRVDPKNFIVRYKYFATLQPAGAAAWSRCSISNGKHVQPDCRKSNSSISRT
jgi:hypothetical protein